VLSGPRIAANIAKLPELLTPMKLVVSYLPVANGSGDRAAWVEYSRPLTRSSHLSSAARPFAILNARNAIRDLAAQTPSAEPARNPSSISRFCVALISLGGGFNLLTSCSGATAAARSAWTDESALACGFAASFTWGKFVSSAISRIATPPMKARMNATPAGKPAVPRCTFSALLSAG